MTSDIIDEITLAVGAGSPAEPPETMIDPANKNSRSEPYACRNDLFPDLSVIQIPIDDLHPASRRVRRGSRRQIDSACASIKRYGFRVPLLVTRDGEIIDGHIRLEAARRLGAETIPCIIVDDLSVADVRRLRLSLNKIQETGSWDDEALHLEIGELVSLDGDLEFPGFDGAEIDALLMLGDDGDDQSDDVDDLSRYEGGRLPPVSRLGDLWILGEHRVLCGSAQDGDATARLVGEGGVAMVFADPPYNVPINGHVRTERGRFEEFAEASGEMNRAEFAQFLSKTLTPATKALAPGGVLYACMDWRHVAEMTVALESLGLKIINICVWVKTNAGMGSLYRSRHEMVFVARKPGGAIRNNVQLGRFGRYRTNVWDYAGATGGPADGDDDFDAHPTVKPIGLVRDAILDVTDAGEWVFDPFLGSGTTLLAAERTRRRCIGIEIDPAYVDLAIRRWQDMTGCEAVHAKTGKTFTERGGAQSDDTGEATEVAPADHSEGEV